MSRIGVSPSNVPIRTLSDNVSKQDPVTRPTQSSEAVRNAPRMRKAEVDENDFMTYALDTLNINDAEVKQFDVEPAADRPISSWKNTIKMPRWILFLLVNAFTILLIVTPAVILSYTQYQGTLNSSCYQNSDCNSFVGLICTTGECSCNTLQYWTGFQCEDTRTYNRSCTSQSQCNSLLNLLCMNVTVGSSINQLCACSGYRYWTGSQCSTLKSYHVTCGSNLECDYNNYLTCITGQCDCNSTQFWNNEYCENKRTYGAQCFSTYWCNSATQGLQCSTWLPTDGTCDCAQTQYWSAGTSTCISLLTQNATCSSTYQCNTNVGLYCSSSTTPASCQCQSNYWYNFTACTSAFVNNITCNSINQCDSTLLLSCNTTAQRCSCNESTYVWDGSKCELRRTIGGDCSTSGQCLSSQNLICATTGIWAGTCACSTNNYWNTSATMCVPKKLWNQTCSTSYECYDGGALSCQPNALQNTTVCDCANYTFYWTGYITNTYSGYCTPKINYGVPSFVCNSTYQCMDYNYVTCINSVCTCSIYQYWDGTYCEPRLNYTYPCNSTSMCRNWSGGPNLQCLTPTGGTTQQCICTTTQYYDYCQDKCYAAKGYQVACTTSTCYPSTMCDQSLSLSCINSICNCSSTQWWTGSTCAAKGTYLASCTTGQDYQCQQYNLLACVASQCQCASTLYWSTTSNYCLSKSSYGGACSSTTQCLTVAGVGLSCISSICQCSSGYYWNTIPQQCDPTG